MRHALASGIPIFPGVNTPSEVEAALELGLSCCKFFPAGTSGGAPKLKDLGGPYGGRAWQRSPGSLRAWAGAPC